MEFEGQRAKLYTNLEWANSPGYIKEILKAGQFKKLDKVLDVGTGTGIMAKAISPLVNRVVGIDISEEMLALSNVNSNVQLILRDIRDSSLEDCSFDKVVARQVFHHIIENTQKAMDECYRVLKPGGLMVFAEGVPSTWEIKKFYTLIFSKKEIRLTFMEEDLVRLLKVSGFNDIKTSVIWERQVSVRNWLTNSALSKRTQKEIFDMHLKYKTLCTKAYNMTITENDCLTDIKEAVVVGKK